MAYTFHVEQLTTIFPAMQKLIVLHWKEIASYQDKIQLMPDIDKYRALEGLGKLLIITVREGEKLIGYSLYILDTHLHYKDDLYAINDILYIHPDYRKGTLAVRLLTYCEKILKQKNVSVITIHMKTSAAFDKLALHCGYDYQERIYTKCIKG